MTQGYCRDRAPAWAQQSPNSSWTCCHFSPSVDAIAIQRMHSAIFSFGGCGKNNLEVFFLLRQTGSQDTVRSLAQRWTCVIIVWKKIQAPSLVPHLCSPPLALLPCAPFLRIYPQDVHGPGPCHMEWEKSFLVTSSVAWQSWFAAVVPAESWHHVKAFISGDMLITNLQKNHGLAVNVPFVYKESFIFRYFPSLLLPPFLGNDHGALTTALMLLEILPLCFICLLIFFSQ